MSDAKNNEVPEMPVLLVDDEDAWLRSFRLTLKAQGITNVLTCRDSRQTMSILHGQPASAVVLDVNMPYMSGVEVLSRIVDTYPELPVLMLSGVDEVDTAVRCLKLGAFDYFVKSDERERLASGVKRAIRLGELQRENATLRRQMLGHSLQRPKAFREIVTHSNSMYAVFHYCEAAAPTEYPVLITGDTGTGKELIARAIHELSGCKGDFVPVNAAGLDDNVFSDTLFGHVRGAFTGADKDRAGLIEKASEGTLFLDEIGDLNNSSQVKLLRLLQEQEYLPLGADTPRRSKARVLVATHHDLMARRIRGEFREDLFYRLQTHHIHLPALRERLEDIPLLVDCFLQDAAERMKKNKPAVPQELFTLLDTYAFPGNVRELESMVVAAMTQHVSHTLSLRVFKERIETRRTSGQPLDETMEIPEQIQFPEELPTIKAATRRLVEEALRRTNGNQGQAAAMLGVTRQALNQRLRKYSQEDDQ